MNKWSRENLYNYDITGVRAIEEWNFENIVIPKQTCVVFETERQKRPVNDYMDIRERLVSEWLPGSGYQFAEGPELALYHWRPVEQLSERYIEIWIPVEKIK